MALNPPFQADQHPVFYGQDAQDDGSTVLTNLEFFPAISLLDFQTRYRVDASQHHDRQVQCLQQSLITVNQKLMNPDVMPDGESWVCRWEKLGYEHLEELPSAMYGNCSEKTFLYFSAVYALAKALLVQRYPEIFFGEKNRTGKQDPDNNTEADYMEEHRQSLSQLMGIPQVTVALI